MTEDVPKLGNHAGGNANQYHNGPPIGGQRISRPIPDEPGFFNLCSSAFAGQRQGPVVQDVMITAGHCASVGLGASTDDQWSIGFPGTYYLGFTLDSAFRNNLDTDSALIIIPNGTAAPDVADINNHAHRAIHRTGTRGDAFDIVNANVCVSGVAHPDGFDDELMACALIENTNVTVNYPEHDPFPATTILRARRTLNGWGFRPGASGGAVISQGEGQEYTNVTRIFLRSYSRAVGIVSGYSGGTATNPDRGLYTHIREAMDELNATVRHDPIDQCTTC